MLATRKYGGFVQKVMNGKQAYVIEIKAEDVHHDIMSRVATKVQWKCSKCNHEWISAINNRVAGNGCPNCHYSPMKNRRDKD